METSSEYNFPIFISSTDYNLKDFRAELARFLSELGYRPILSSAEGFPDSSPILEPWESCLPVLDKCFVTVLVIDGRYGQELKFPNFKDCFSDKKLSPTHAEYIYAHKARKRMLVFIRKALMPLYQSYRTAVDKCNGDKQKAKAALAITLPDHVSFETLDFINEVKTTKPIPWINEFEDITSVKKEIQKKMLNELAELFLIKNKHYETVIEAFNKVMDSLSLDEQKNALSKINATKEIIDAVEMLATYKTEISQAKEEIGKAHSASKEERENSAVKIADLNKKINDLEKQSRTSSKSQFFIDNGQVKIGNPNFAGGIYGNINPNNSIGLNFSISHTDSSSLLAARNKCDNCGKTEPLTFSHWNSITLGSEFNKCPSCNRVLCNDCWPKNGIAKGITVSSLTINPEKCPKCVSEGK